MKRLVLLLVSLCTAALFTASPAAADFAFSTTALEPAQAHVEDVAIGDLDHRNGPDIVTAYSEGGISVQLNDGHGNFGAPHDYATGCDTTQVEIADVGAPPNSITPDGNLDVVFACSLGGGETIYLGRMFGDGNGGLSAPDMFAESAYGSFNGLALSHQSFALVEFRGPNGPPIPTWSYEYQEAGFKFHRLFCLSYDWATKLCTTPGGAEEPYVPFVPGIVAEAELFTTGGTEGVEAWGPNPFWHAGESDFGPVPTVIEPATSIWRSIAIGDLASDGPDIITAAGTCGCVPEEPATGRVSVDYGNSAGVLPQVATTFPSVPGVENINTGDFDLDGHTDVVGTDWHYSSATGGVGGVFFQAGDGAGHIGAPQELTLYHGETWNTAPIRVADLDGNGTPDLVAVVGNKVQVLLNQRQRAPSSTPPVAPISKLLGGSPLGGIKGLNPTATALPTGYVLLGTATNPPTKAVDLTITLPAAGAKGSSLTLSPRSKGGKKKPTVIGKAHIAVPAGKTVPLKVKLSHAALRQLKKGPLHAKLTLVATSTSGAKGTKTEALTIKPAKRKPKK